MTEVRIPAKPYFRIGEAAQLLGVETHVLRYWESEFPQLEPVRAPSGQRLYHRKHLETLFIIKDLLHEQGFTIAGARKYLLEQQNSSSKPANAAVRPAPVPQVLLELFPANEPAFRQDRAAHPWPKEEILAELRALVRILKS